MRRSLAILVWIILGALAATLGIGSVLLSAKHDRDALAEQLQQEQIRFSQLQQEHTQLINEANQTVQAAVRNASATRDLLNTVTSEQAALETAIPLNDRPQTKRWSQTISFPLGISVRTPTYTQSTSTDTSIQSVLQGGYDQPIAWLSITRYDAGRAQDLVRALSNTTQVNYRLNQTLISGTRGISPEGSVIFVLHTQRLGQISYLIWARVNSTITEDRILDSLSTLLFASAS